MAQITLNSSGVASSGSLLLQTNGTTTQATFDTSGNLGLGVTPSAWASGGKALELPNGSSLFTYTNTSQVILTSNAYFNGTNWIYKATNAAANYEQGVGKHIWYNAPSGTAGNTITFTQAMTLDASNNLLLGTTTASANFYVYGAPVSYAGLNTTAILSSSAQSTGTGGLLAFEGKYTSGGALANFAAIGGLKENSTDSNCAGYLGFYTRSNGSLAAERARIDSIS